jgi:hypothetical protein
MRFCNWSDIKCASNFVQISEKVWQKPWQWLDKGSGKKAWAVHRESKLTKTDTGETGGEQSQEHAHNFFSHQGDCSQRIRSGRPNSQLCILLWCFMVTARKCAKTSHPNFGDEGTSWCITTMHHLTLPFSPGIFWPKTTRLSSPTHPTFLSFPDWI